MKHLFYILFLVFVFCDLKPNEINQTQPFVDICYSNLVNSNNGKWFAYTTENNTFITDAKSHTEIL